MLSILKLLRILLYAESPDLRKSFTGLIGIVTEELQLDPLDGSLLLIRNRTDDATIPVLDPPEQQAKIGRA